MYCCKAFIRLPQYSCRHHMRWCIACAPVGMRWHSNWDHASTLFRSNLWATRREWYKNCVIFIVFGLFPASTFCSLQYLFYCSIFWQKNFFLSLDIKPIGGLQWKWHYRRALDQQLSHPSRLITLLNVATTAICQIFNSFVIGIISIPVTDRRYCFKSYCDYPIQL